MKILIVNGSPRKGGNSYIASRFLKGMLEEFHEVSLFDTGVNISGCRACGGCFAGGRPCVIDDRMQEVYPVFAEADGIICVSPIYGAYVTAPMKAFSDRLYPYLSGRGKCVKKAAGLVLIAGDHEDENFQAVLLTYRYMQQYFGFRDVGTLLIRDTLEKGAIDTPERMDMLRGFAELWRQP